MNTRLNMNVRRRFICTQQPLVCTPRTPQFITKKMSEKHSFQVVLLGSKLSKFSREAPFILLFTTVFTVCFEIEERSNSGSVSSVAQFSKSPHKGLAQNDNMQRIACCSVSFYVSDLKQSSSFREFNFLCLGQNQTKNEQAQVKLEKPKNEPQKYVFSTNYFKMAIALEPG